MNDLTKTRRILLIGRHDFLIPIENHLIDLGHKVTQCEEIPAEHHNFDIAFIDHQHSSATDIDSAMFPVPCFTVIKPEMEKAQPGHDEIIRSASRRELQLSLWLAVADNQDDAGHRLHEISHSMELVLDPVYLLDEDANLLYVNPAACKSHGWHRKDLLQKKIYEFDDQLDSISWQEAWKQVIDHGAVKFDSIHLNKEGQQYPVEITASPYKLGARQLILAISRDISARRQAESELLREQKRARQYLEVAEISMVALDRQGLVTMVNPKVCQTLGYPKEQLLGINWFDKVLTEEDLEPIRQVFASLMDGNDVTYRFLTNMVITASGELLRMQWHNSLIINDDGEITGLLSSGIDITEQTRAQVQLVNQAALNQLLSTISRDLFSASSERLGDEIRTAIAQVGALFAGDRCYVFDFDPKTSQLNNTYEWCNQGIEPQIDYLQNMDASLIPAWMSEIQADRPVIIDDVFSLDTSWSAERELLQGQSIQSLLAVPIHNQQGLCGFLGLDSVHCKREWLTEEVNTLRLFGDLISLARQNTQNLQALENAEFRWKFALEGSGQGVWDWNAQTNKVYFSHQWKEMLGYRHDEISSSMEEWSNRVHPQDRSDTLKDLNNHLEGRTPVYHNEHRIQHRNGEYRWILDRGLVVTRDANGNAMRVIGTHTDITETHLNRQRIMDSEAQLEAIFNNSQVGIMMITGYRRLARCNQRMADITGFESPEQMLGLSMREFHLNEQNFIEFGERFYNNLRQQKILHIEYPIKKQDGSAIWCLLSGKALDSATPPDLSNGVIWVVEDIDHIKQTERELREQRDLFSGGPTMVFQWLPGEGWPIHFCSSNVHEILGYDLSRLHGGEIPFASLIHPDDFSHVATEVEQYLSSGINYFEQEYRVRHADGHYLYCYDYTQIQRDENGQPRLIYGYLLDVSERRRAELELQESSQRYTDVVKSTSDGFWTVDLDGIIHEVNDAYCRLSGYAREEIIDHHVSRFDVNNNQEDVKKRLAMIKQEGSLTFETIHRRKDGSIWPVEISVSFSQVQKGLVFSFMRDLSERTEAEHERLRLQREMQQAQKMEALGQLSGGVAHEFNNMLAIILGNTGFIANLLPEHSNPKLPTFVNNIEIAATRATELTRQMLTFSRPSEPQTEQIDLQKAIPQAISLSQGSLPSSLQIEFSADSIVPKISLDTLELQQVLTNLLVNARDAMDGKGLISVNAMYCRHISDECLYCHSALQGGWVQISVTDRGHGITQEHMSRLFDPFFSTKEVGKGTGLGLSVVQAIVENNGGHILVDSDPRQGTTFRLLFPAIAVDQDPKVVKSSVASSHSQKAYTGHILVVDDEPSLTFYLSEILSTWGHQVTSMNSSQEALNLIKNQGSSFNILVTDQTMPGLQGTELVAAAKHASPGLKCILWTGHSEVVNEFSAPEYGIDCFLEKPVNPDELHRNIQKLLKDTHTDGGTE